MAKVVVVGAGAMGLAAAYRAAKNGHEVDLIEAAPEPGGMAGHFDFDGVSVERFYHFAAKSDHPTFELMDELGIGPMMQWRPTTMGIITGGKLHRWGDPLALFRFPHLSLLQKIRYGLFALVSVKRDNWPAIENENAKSWIVRWCGKGVYERLWRPLFDYKFYEYADSVSALWIWTRIRRIGRSRESMMQEVLGYIEGGSITLVNALMDAFQKHGGRVHLGEPATEITTEAGKVTGVRTARTFYPADAVICTSPTPHISKLVPSLPDDWKQRYNSIHNIGVICVIFKLKRAVTPHFWVNVSEPGVEIPGFIELTNLRDIGGDSIVYVPYYMPVTHPKFAWPEDKLIDEAFRCLQLGNASLTREDIRAIKVARLRYGQPVCEPGFAAKIPPVQTPFKGLQIADTCYYYPEDRGIAESVRLGQDMANAVTQSVESLRKDAELSSAGR